MTSGKCPNCGKLAIEDFRPFCSRRCANVDLVRWLDGRYAIPTDEVANMEPSGSESDHSE